MADSLYPVILAEIEHTVQTSAHGDSARIRLCDAKGAELLALNPFHLVGLWIVFVLRLLEEPVLPVRYRGVEIQVVQQSEGRKPDGEVVRHAVLETVQETFLTELRGLEVDLVLKRSGVSKGYLLVCLFLADPVLLLERVERAD